jgi:hypothetical protein
MRQSASQLKGIKMSWLMQHRVERRASRMHEMMKRLGVNPGVLARVRSANAYAKARSLCFFCGTSDKCLRWLDERAPASKEATFCPNLSLFDRYRRLQGSAELAF